MALPTLITITGTYLKSDGSPEEGTVVFRSKVTAYHNASSSILAPDTRMVELNGSGSFSIQVPATDDPSWIPVGWTYKVSVNLGESVTTFNAVVPYNAPGGTISIASLAPVANSGGSGGGSGDLINYIPKSVVSAKGDILVGVGLADVSKISVGTNGQVLQADSTKATGLVWANASGAVSSVNGYTGAVSLVKGDIGLGNVDNTSDLNKPISTATQTALDGKSSTSHNHDSLYIRKDLFTTKGDILVVTGAGAVTRLAVGTNGQVLKVNSAASAGVEWGTDISGGGGGAVTSVNTYTGDVVLVKADVGLGNVDNTSDVNKPVSSATTTALNGKQASSADLTAIAGLSPTNNDILQRKSGAWTNRTIAQYKSDLALTKSDVGLGNVDNTQQQPINANLTTISGLSPSNDDILQRKSGAWANRTVAQFKTDLALTKSDVGLGNVDNTADSAKPVSSAQATAIALKPDLKAWNGSSYGAISNGVIYVGGSSDPTVNNGDIWIDTSSATDFSVTNNLTVGGNLTVSGIGAFVSKVRSTNATARSTASMTADDVLTATLGLGTWIITVKAIYLGSDGTADFQISYTAPTGSLYNRISAGILASNTATGATDKAINHQAAVAIGTGMVFATTTTADFAEETLIYNVTTSGTFSVNWARSGASGSATLLAGSYFLAQRIA